MHYSMHRRSGKQKKTGMNQMIEIRIHGRGGQGGVTLAKILAAAEHREGKSVQAFGVYAAERSGAPSAPRGDVSKATAKQATNLSESVERATMRLSLLELETNCRAGDQRPGQPAEGAAVDFILACGVAAAQACY
jgi:hypothetical protein